MHRRICVPGCCRWRPLAMPKTSNHNRNERLNNEVRLFGTKRNSIDVDTKLTDKSSNDKCASKWLIWWWDGPAARPLCICMDRERFVNTNFSFFHIFGWRNHKKLNEIWPASHVHVRISSLCRRVSRHTTSSNRKEKKLFRLIITMSAYWHIMNINVPRIEMCWTLLVGLWPNREQRNEHFCRADDSNQWRRRGRIENKENEMWTGDSENKKSLEICLCRLRLCSQINSILWFFWTETKNNNHNRLLSTAAK